MTNEIERLILDPKPHLDLTSLSQEYWDGLARLTDVEMIELTRILLVSLAKRIEGEGAESYSSELQAQAVRHVLDLFQRSVR